VKLIIFIVSILLSFTSVAEQSKQVIHPKIGVRTVTFFDKSRDRPITTEIFYPADPKAKTKILESVWKREPEARDSLLSIEKDKYPLILFSHGYQGSRFNSIWLMYALVKKGYIVASVEHYGDTSDLFLPKEILKPWNRPKDVSFVITEILQDSFLKDRIDSDKIGFVGFSNGGFTGIWLAGGRSENFDVNKILSKYPIQAIEEDPSLLDNINYDIGKKSYFDPRIKAFFLMAPSFGFVFDKAGLKQIKKPVSIVSGAEDEVVNIHENAEHYAQYIPHSTLWSIPGKVGHFVFLSEPSRLGKKQLPSILIVDDPSINRAKIHKEVEAAAIKFFFKTNQVTATN
jgi:predicted dienelactone hydrolase